MSRGDSYASRPLTALHPSFEVQLQVCALEFWYPMKALSLSQCSMGCTLLPCHPHRVPYAEQLLLK